MEVGRLKFTWKLKNFSTLKAEELYSDVFSLGPYKWMIQAYPKGKNVVDHLSVFLEVAESETLPSGWSRIAQYSLTVINQIDKKSSITRCSASKRKFDAVVSNWGFRPFIPHKELHDPNKGYLVDDTCIIKADVTIYEDASVDSHGPSKLEVNEEDMKTFFVDLNSVIFPKEVVTSQEEARQAMTLIEKALNMAPADLYGPGRMSQLTNAFDVLSSLDDCSIVASEQKAELVSMKDNIIDLSERVAAVVRIKKMFTEKELVRKTLDDKLGRCLTKFEKANAEAKQYKQDIDMLHKQIVMLYKQIAEKKRKEEDSISMQKQMYKQSKELKAELDALVKHWTIYEARMNAAEEEEKVIGKEWSEIKQLFSSLKIPTL